MPLRSKKNPKITTKDRNGKPNGFLIPIFNVHDGFVADAQNPKQVYLTVVAPGTTKGPHLHMTRWGMFTCVKGNIKIVIRGGAGYEEHFSGEDHAFATIQLPAGVPAALVNIGDEDAYVLNMPAPAWHVEDQDDHPASFPDYQLP
jgi:dTDP-4-dehydrorhamnose 3,5-epimerase-like enzyme